jgi:23S rRNA (cytosine1962-C5)-methyltransferase
LNTLILKSGREKSSLNQHPWIFSGAVKEFPKSKDGEIIAVADNHNHVLGFGFYAPNSQIVCRFFYFNTLLDANISTPVFDYEFWKIKFENAIAIRDRMVRNSDTNTFRLIHAEGDFLPGLIVDIYNDTAVMQLLIKGTENLKDIFVKCLQELGFKYIYVKTKVSSKELEGISQPSAWLTDSKQGEKCLVLEHNLKFQVDVENGQKTGFFIDQRENRLLLQKLSNSKKVLNTFAYSGGFSVYAIAGGAKEVVSVDISKDAIKNCDENIAINFPTEEQASKHQSYVADCFDFLKKNEQIFDIIILDPPAFAKNAKSVPAACRGYKELNMLGIKAVSSGGLIFTFSCSQHIDAVLFQKIVFGAASDIGRKVRILQHLQQPSDHPINIYHPEGSYLKGLLLWVE